MAEKQLSGEGSRHIGWGTPHRVPNKTNPKRNTVTHIIIKTGKVKW